MDADDKAIGKVYLPEKRKLLIIRFHANYNTEILESVEVRVQYTKDTNNPHLYRDPLSGFDVIPGGEPNSDNGFNIPYWIDDEEEWDVDREGVTLNDDPIGIKTLLVLYVPIGTISDPSAPHVVVVSDNDRGAKIITMEEARRLMNKVGSEYRVQPKRVDDSKSDCKLLQATIEWNEFLAFISLPLTPKTSTYHDVMDVM